jgi:putative radical SAM enzyme (TIGR03279 family)
VNGQTLRDVIDFQFHAADDRVELLVERDQALLPPIALARRGPDLGITLAAPRAGEIATCANKCVFCFIHQLPRGLRKSLYVKDDDYRLSFLHGNYITLSDLDEAALARIVEQHLSPLYVSVHATDPALRHQLLGRPRHSAEILPRMERLAKAGIRMHAQIVLCPGLNDGEQLRRTVFDLVPIHPHVTTVAVVPVGLTRHRERLPALRTLTADEARRLVDAVESWQSAFLAALDTRFVFLADEIYLLAGRDVPSSGAYEGFPVQEDGIGLVRRFEDEFVRACRRMRRSVPGAGGSAGIGRPPVKSVTIVTGEMYGPRLAALVDALDEPRGRVRVAPVPNELLGRGIGVAGLLCGRDIQRHLASLDRLGDEILVPSVTVRDGDRVFLDDLTPADLARDLGVRIRLVEPTGAALLHAIQHATLSRKGPIARPPATADPEEPPGSPGPLRSVGRVGGTSAPLAATDPEERPGSPGPLRSAGGAWGAMSGLPTRT